MQVTYGSLLVCIGNITSVVLSRGSFNQVGTWEEFLWVKVSLLQHFAI